MHRGDQEKWESVGELQALLISCLHDNIERLSRIKTKNTDIKHEIIKKKLAALDHYKLQVGNTGTILDLIMLANVMLLDQDVINKKFGEKSKLENSIISFLKQINNKFSQKNSSMKTNLINLFNFTDQIELVKLLNSYIHGYAEKYPDLVFPEFNGMQMIKSQDGAAVFFDPYAFINEKTKSSRIDNAAIGKKIINAIKEACAYMLMQNMDPSAIENLRLCFAVNHHKRHWTSLLIDVNGFSNLYKKIYDCKSLANQEWFFYGDNSQVLHSAQYEFIYDALEIKSNDPDFYEMAHALEKEISLTLTHFDSMNFKQCYYEIVDCIIELSKILNIRSTQQRCSQQKGNTCGDHTILNLTGMGLYRTLPFINEPESEVSSSVLRACTMEANQNDKNDHANAIIQEAVINHMLNKKTEADRSDLPDNPLADSLMKISLLYTERISLLAPNSVTDILNTILTIEAENVADMEKILKTKIEKYIPEESSFFEPVPSELEEKVFTLAGIIYDSNNKMKQLIFNEIGIADEDCAPYCAVARLFIQGQQAVIESRNLASMHSVEEQKAALNSFKK